MKSNAILHWAVRLLGLVALLFAFGAHAQIFPADESAQVKMIVVDEMSGDLIAAPPNVSDSHGAIDDTASAEDTVVDEMTGDLIAAPANAVDSHDATDDTAIAEDTVVDEMSGDLIAAPANAVDSHGALEHGGSVADTKVNTVTGDLNAAPAQYTVPEPAFVWLLVSGALLLVGVLRRRP